MNKRKINDSLTNLGKAVGKLKDALQVPTDRELVFEGTIQRFEYVIELCWKTMKRALEYEGIKTKTPRESIKQAYAVDWINDETAWLDMLDSRNTTSHLYLHEDLIENAYNDIKKNFPEIERIYKFLLEKYSEEEDD